MGSVIKEIGENVIFFSVEKHLHGVSRMGRKL
jgi:hypothetical protein